MRELPYLLEVRNLHPGCRHHIRVGEETDRLLLHADVVFLFERSAGIVRARRKLRPKRARERTKLIDEDP